MIIVPIMIWVGILVFIVSTTLMNQYCPFCGKFVEPGHWCDERPHRIGFKVDLFRLEDTVQKVREWWWKLRHKDKW